MSQLDEIIGGWFRSDGFSHAPTSQAAVASLIETLSEYSYGIVKFPEPTEVGDYGPVWETSGRYNGPVGTVQYRPETRRVEIRDDYEHDYPPEAVEVDGLVLLAAARWAVTHA